MYTATYNNTHNNIQKYVQQHTTAYNTVHNMQYRWSHQPWCYDDKQFMENIVMVEGVYHTDEVCIAGSGCVYICGGSGYVCVCGGVSISSHNKG